MSDDKDAAGSGAMESSDEADVQAQPDDTTHAGAVKPPPPKRGALMAIALLLSIGSAVGLGYLYYVLIYLAPLEKLRVEGSALESRFEQVDNRFSAAIEATEEQTALLVENLAAGQSERLAAVESSVAQSLAQALQAAPPSQREWKLAEAEYLLRIANHRVLMEQDSVGALDLLQAADEILAELDDFALHTVRARLADEQMALRRLPRNDTQGIYLRIESIKSQLSNLPLSEPVIGPHEVRSGVNQSAWDVLVEEFSKFVRLRTLNDTESIKPLLLPEEVRYLELNIRLALEQAQLATLKRQQPVFEQSLLNVRRWLVSHADIHDARLAALLLSLDELLVLELAHPLPEISGSLNELLKVRRGG